ncbi:MAG: hypothetical protein IJV55_01925, partial [Paludibacteraceae bacterium]|nr:hypothetical protein [Paludibacteraceae bacterium]
MFTWKRHKDIFKGEGIYHLTFVVLNRKPILGTLQMEGGEAQMIPSALGRAISRDLSALHHRRPYCRLLAKQLMPDHIHVLIWITADCGVSVKEIARGMLQGWRKLAALESGTLATHGAVDINRQMPSAEIYKQPPLFSVPFLRTLSRKGQLNRMIAYIHDNPRRAMLLRLNPDLFRLRREVQAEGLTFTALGNLFLLDYPQRQSVECSRSAAAERIAAQQEAVMQAATEGAVT